MVPQSQECILITAQTLGSLRDVQANVQTHISLSGQKLATDKTKFTPSPCLCKLAGTDSFTVK